MTVAPAAAIAERVDQVLDRLLTDERARWEAVDADLAAPFEALASYVQSGGKRLRPAFCYWAFVGIGGAADDPGVAVAGAALELLHAAALIHDDVIDGSAIRHGADALHVRFTSEHRRHGWSGPPDRFGEGVAIVVGDLALAYCGHLLASAPPAARAVFDQMRIEVNVGQYLDVVGATGRHDPAGPGAEDRARRITTYKTAKYTVEGPMLLGAALAAPDRLEELAEPISAFALPLGQAFQLRDDLLGVFGDPATTGKPVGDDLREGKLTLLVARALSTRPPDSRTDRLSTRLGNPDLTDGEIAELQEAIVASGARAEVAQAIRELQAEAAAGLDRLPFDPTAAAALAELAAFAAGRNH